MLLSDIKINKLFLTFMHERSVPAGLVFICNLQAAVMCQTGSWQYLQACHGIVYLNTFHNYLRNLILTEDRVCKQPSFLQSHVFSLSHV